MYMFRTPCTHFALILSCPHWQALFGVFLFEESVALMWWFGASLVVAGLVVMQYGAHEPHSTNAVSEKKTT